MAGCWQWLIDAQGNARGEGEPRGAHSEPQGAQHSLLFLLGSDCFRLEKESQSHLHAKAAPLGLLPQMLLSQWLKLQAHSDSKDSMLALTKSKSHQLQLKTSLGVAWLLPASQSCLGAFMQQ